ncbi:MAG: TRAP transporter substrate-binding protein DctP [Proteobacteria bacterium]|nr:TRAP transporter substrate-binding protein DctP [Pseudomonadota bacterium]
MNSRRQFLQLAGGGVIVAANSSFALAAAKHTAKIGHLESPAQPRHRGLEKVAALVAARTNGEVEFKLFPASQLGNARQMIEGTQFGSLECTVEPAAFLGGFDPVVSVFDIPFLLPDDPAKANELRTGRFGQFVLDSFSSRGFVAVALWPNGRKSMTSNRPLTNLAAFSGQKFRVMDSKILIEQFGAVGANAIALPFGELYTALQTGVVDGEENPLDTITTMKFDEVQKYLVVSNHGAMEDVVLFNPKWWNGLPAGHRKIITEVFIEVRPEVEKMKDEATAKALAQIKAAGKVEIRTLSDEERKEWRARMLPKAEIAYTQRAGDEGKKALEIYHAEIKRLGIAS